MNQKMHSASTEIKQIVQEVKWNINQTAQKYLAHNDILYGIKQFNSKDYKVAEFYLKKGLLLFPDDPKALKYLAWTYFFQKRYDKSLTTFQQARSFSPKDPNPVIGAAWSYYGIKYFQKALDTFETAESITPWNYEVFKGKGFSFLQLQTKENAKKEFAKIYNSTQILEILSDWERMHSKNFLMPMELISTPLHSMTIFQLPIEHPRYPSTLFAHEINEPYKDLDEAWTFYHEGKFKKAAIRFQDSKGSDTLDGKNGLAWALLSSGKFLEAEPIFKAIEINYPGFPGILDGMKEIQRIKRQKTIHANYYLNLKKYSLATKHFQKLVSKYGQWAYPESKLGLIDLILKDYDSAYLHFLNALKIDPDYTEAQNGIKKVYKVRAPLLLKAHQAREKKLFKMASQLYMDYIDSPDEGFKSDAILSEAYQGLGWSYFNKKQYVLAIRKFKKAVHHPKFKYDAARGLGTIYYMRQDFKNAAKYLTIAEEKKANQQEIAYKLDWSILQSQPVRKAEVYFKKILGDHPLRASAYMGLGWIYYHKKNPDLAVEYFLKAISLDPDFALTKEFSDLLEQERFGWQIYNRFGWAYYQRKHFEKSLYLFKVALNRRPESSETIKGLGYIYFKTGAYQKAIIFLKQSLSLNRKPASVEEWVEGDKAISPFETGTNVLSKIGWSYFFLEKYLDAIQEFNRAIKTYGDSATIQDGLGWTYFKLDRLNEARIAFQNALKFQPLNNSAHIGLKAVKQKLTEEKFEAANTSPYPNAT